MHSLQRTLCALFAVGTMLACSTENIHAGSATWKINPDSGDWLNADNWSAGGPPNGASDAATFGTSSVTAINIAPSQFVEVNQITFLAGASAYTFTGPLTISGVGIINNSGITQHFVKTSISNPFSVKFTNDASAGSLVSFDGLIEFHDRSNAGTSEIINSRGSGAVFFDFSSASNATIANNPAAESPPGTTIFRNNSTAANALIVNNGATNSIPHQPGEAFFYENSTASHATIISNGGTASGALGGLVGFTGNSSGDAAIIIANGGSNGGRGGEISFYQDSTGGTSRIELFGNGHLDISLHNLNSGVTIGSLEGTGTVFLGSRKLIVGSNNTSTSFSGVIRDTGGQDFGAVGGSLAKIGTGTLILSGTNTYTGPTTVQAGNLIVNGSILSAVTVNGGTLGGSGTTGGITVNTGGTLAPGNSAGILSVNGNLTLTMGATYLVDLNGTAVGTAYDQADVIGNVDVGNAALSLNVAFAAPLGTAFTIIDNDFSDLVEGMFDGLPDGATFSADGQFFTITYHGGDGNDVVLTVVPEPPTWILIFAGVAALVAMRKRGRPTSV